MNHTLPGTHIGAKQSVSNLIGEFEEISDTPERHRAGTVFTPIRIDTRKLALRAVYFQSPIDLKLLLTHYPPSQVLSAHESPYGQAEPGSRERERAACLHATNPSFCQIP